ncbi:MAG TPA: prolipoprotein diacylglyceryl transferase [Sediminispirochaeta sp.]|mgnify:CR=1 FL=1|nr:prolipoprotein diacylglyceryl transferase [Sediminispirochaeta sp.]
MIAYLEFPSWIRPEIIPGLPFHWYGMMYLVAFLVTYLLFKYQIAHDRLQLEMSDDDVVNLFFWTILGLLLVARIFAALVYDTSGRYLQKPWLIFWPFDENMRLVGLQGMSYHGGVIGAFLGGALYCRYRRLDFFQITDIVVAGIPLGYTFGRLGNFINGELWGRVTESGIGMIFPHAPSFSTRHQWVREVADAHGIDYSAGEMLQLPRHPSQLYEAFFEGIFLWLILWFILRPRRRYSGQILGYYLIGYGVVRFFIEYFREPDIGIGYPISFAAQTQPQALFLSPWNFSTGQILCVLMMIGGLGLLWWRRRRAKL